MIKTYSFPKRIVSPDKIVNKKHIDMKMPVADDHISFIINAKLNEM